MNILVISVVLLGASGAVAGAMLAVASRVFAVKVDPRIESIEKLLPGANCGGCGNPSCFGYATRIVEEGLAPNLCVLAPEAGLGIGEILGVAVTARVPQVAAVRCYGGAQSAKRHDYTGLDSCRAAVLLHRSDSRCRYSCLGFGDCVRVCPFDAIRTCGHRQAPVVDRDACTGCGNCVRECPQELIMLVPRDALPHIACNSREKGKAVRDVCPVGCASCGLCVKTCPEGAITMVDNRPEINYEKCTRCGLCIEKCPRKIIVALTGAGGGEAAGNQ